MKTWAKELSCNTRTFAGLFLSSGVFWKKKKKEKKKAKPFLDAKN